MARRLLSIARPVRPAAPVLENSGTNRENATMALPFLNGAARKRDQLLSIDLGGRTTKAGHLHRKGERYVLSGYALVNAPIYEKPLSRDLLAEHLKSVCQALNAKSRNLSLSVGVSDS